MIAGAGTPIYMAHLKKAKIHSLFTTAQGFQKAFKVCLTVNNDDLTKCNTKLKLKFLCDNCSTVGVSILNDRVTTTISEGDYTACAIATRHEFPLIFITNVRMCYNRVLTDGLLGSMSKSPLRIQFCSQDSDCADFTQVSGGGSRCRKHQGTVAGPQNIHCH